MPEEIEQSSEQQESGTEEVVEETATGGEDGTDQQDDAQEAESGEEKPFDRKKFEAALRKKNSEAENLRKRLKEQEPLLAELKKRKEAELSESERLTEQLTAAQEQIAKTRQRLVRSQVQALAGIATDGRAAFADPADAFGELDLDSYIDGDGDIDEAAIEADLQALLERKPHWAKTQPRRAAASRTGSHTGVRRQQDTPPHPRRRVLRVA